MNSWRISIVLSSHLRFLLKSLATAPLLSSVRKSGISGGRMCVGISRMHINTSYLYSLLSWFACA